MWYTSVYHMISTSFPAVYRWYTYGKIHMVMYTCIPRVYQMAFSIWFLCVQNHFKSSCILSIGDVIWLFHVYTICNTCGYGHVHMYSTCIPDGISIWFSRGQNHLYSMCTNPHVYHMYKTTCIPHVQNHKISTYAVWGSLYFLTTLEFRFKVHQSKGCANGKYYSLV